MRYNIIRVIEHVFFTPIMLNFVASLSHLHDGLMRIVYLLAFILSLHRYVRFGVHSCDSFSETKVKGRGISIFYTIASVHEGLDQQLSERSGKLLRHVVVVVVVVPTWYFSWRFKESPERMRVRHPARQASSTVLCHYFSCQPSPPLPPWLFPNPHYGIIIIVDCVVNRYASARLMIFLPQCVRGEWGGLKIMDIISSSHLLFLSPCWQNSNFPTTAITS